MEQLFGAKNRVTGAQLGRIAMKALNPAPAPMAWAETLDGLRQGLIHGAETWASPAAYARMTPVAPQCVDLKFFCRTERTSMSSKVLNSLDGHLQDAVLGSSCWAQVHVQGANKAALVNTGGFSDPQLPETMFAKDNVRQIPAPDRHFERTVRAYAYPPIAIIIFVEVIRRFVFSVRAPWSMTFPPVLFYGDDVVRALVQHPPAHPSGVQRVPRRHGPAHAVRVPVAGRGSVAGVLHHRRGHQHARRRQLRGQFSRAPTTSCSGDTW